MSGHEDNDLQRDGQFRRGLELFQTGEYWEAHECWEAVWLSLPKPSAARRATKALIQLAAICHKPEQAAGGRSETRMQRGMAHLIETARDHLDASVDLGTPTPHFDRTTVNAAVDRLEALLERWRSGTELAEISSSIADLAANFSPDAS